MLIVTAECNNRM